METGADGYQHWSQNHKNYGNGWSGYHNSWNKNWDRRADVRNWNPQPYYGEFIGGVFLGSISWWPTASASCPTHPSLIFVGTGLIRT